jgi:iron-sulfur cluster repair protein YtfE (RIC family)
MSIIGNFMTADHRQCDEALAGAEEAVHGGDWGAASAAFQTFHAAMLRHIAMEDDVLFPAFEDATGMSHGGPTETMRVEHEQMRTVFDEMKGALAKRDANQYLGLCETLLVLMQQHNLKEEQMMYPMLDQALGEQAGELIGRCNALETA